jgi:type II secretion system protein H
MPSKPLPVFHRVQGFTLIEVMITIAIVAILVAVGVPSMNAFFDKKRLIKGAEAVYSELQLARSEAIARSQDTFVNFSWTDAETWFLGSSNTTGCNPAVTTPADQADWAASSVCFLVIDDGDGTIDDGTGTVDSDDLVLKRSASTDYAGVNMTAAPTFTGDGGANEIVFDFVRGTASSGSISLQSDAGAQIQIDISLVGRISICSPAGATTKVQGYKDC